MDGRHTVGSTGSCDVFIVVQPSNRATKLVNLAPGVRSEQVGGVVAGFLDRFELRHFHPHVYYNGANHWVMEARFEAMSMLLQRLPQGTGEGDD